jgi:hypothetical protein
VFIPVSRAIGAVRLTGVHHPQHVTYYLVKFFLLPIIAQRTHLFKMPVGNQLYLLLVLPNSCYQRVGQHSGFTQLCKQRISE